MQQFNAPQPPLPDTRPPHNLEAEQGLIGALLLDNGLLDRIESGLLGLHFFDPLLGDLFDCIAQMHRSGRLANPVTLKARYANAPPVGALSVPQFLGQLAARAATSISVPDYARVVHDHALRRLLIVAGEDLVRAACDLAVDRPAQTILEAAEEQLHALAPAGPNERTATSLSSTLAEAITEINDLHASGGRIAGLSTGLCGLDEFLGGLRRGTFNVLAGRPSMGKTACATTIARDIAADGHAVAFFSLEMSRRELAMRLLASAAALPVHRLTSGTLLDGEMKSLVEAEHRLGQLPLTIDDSSALTIAQIHARARRLHRQGKLDVLIVDYLGLIRPSAAYAGNKVHEVGEITAGLKAIAKELDVPVVALCQLNRAVENRDNKRPTLSDLRDSGSIEQDADVVMFLFREEYYLERDKPPASDRSAYADWLAACEAAAGKAELIISKNRQGPIGTVDLMFDARTTTFKFATEISETINDRH